MTQEPPPDRLASPDRPTIPVAPAPLPIWEDGLLLAVARSSLVFLTQSDLPKAMAECLQVLGTAVLADRAYVFRNTRDPANGRILMSQEWEWARSGVSPQIRNPELQNLPCDILGPAPVEALAAGRPVLCDTRASSSPLRSILESQGILSMLLVPIHVHDVFWGHIGFDDCTRGRSWSEGEIAILQAATGCIGGALERKHLEERLQEAHKMEAVGQLAGGIAHDFNNILASMLLNLGLIGDRSDLAPETRDALRELESEARRATSLVHQLLTFGGRSRIEPQPCDANELIRNSLGHLRRRVGDRIQVDFTPHPHLPMTHGDAGMLDQVLAHLADNARDAMPDGGTLTFSTQPSFHHADPGYPTAGGRQGTFVCITATDTGIGIDPAVSRKVFEPFFTTKEVGKGSGLGLALSYSIVQQHHGWIEVDSLPGQGTRFRIFLPATPPPPSPPPRRQSQPQFDPAQPMGRETILLVDDEPAVRRTVGIFLRRQGYQVLEAANSTEAQQLWESHAPSIDLLFSDMVMPEGLSGLQLATRLRDSRPSLKVIIASGYSPDLIQVDATTAGRITFVTKPCPAKALLATVRAVLDGTPAPSAAP